MRVRACSPVGVGGDRRRGGPVVDLGLRAVVERRPDGKASPAWGGSRRRRRESTGAGVWAWSFQRHARQEARGVGLRRGLERQGRAGRRLRGPRLGQRDELVGVDFEPLGQPRLQGLEHLRRALVAALGAYGEHAVDDERQPGRHPRRKVLHRRRRLRADPDHQLERGVGPDVGRPPGEGLVEHHAERPDVGAEIDALAPLGLLRGHVVGRAEHAARARQRRVIGPVQRHRLGDTEIDDLEDDPAVLELGEEQVGRLDVAVEDAGLVRPDEPEAGLPDEAHAELGRELAAALQELLEVLPLEELHGHVDEARRRVGAGVEDVDDVGRLEGAGEPRLPLEALDHLVVAGHLGTDDLEGHVPARSHVSDLVDGAHAALAEHGEDLVPTVNRAADAEHVRDGTVGACATATRDRRGARDDRPSRQASLRGRAHREGRGAAPRTISPRYAGAPTSDGGSCSSPITTRGRLASRSIPACP